MWHRFHAVTLWNFVPSGGMEINMKITMMNVAQKANVSIATVARVVSGNGYVSESVKSSVQEVIDQLGYVASKNLSSKKKFKEGVIGLVVPHSSSNMFFQLLSTSVNEAARSKGFQVLTINSGEDISEIPYLVDSLIKKNVDGIIFSSFIQDKVPDDIREYMDNLNKAVVMIERPAEYFGVDKVLVNNTEGTFDATNYLIGKGHTEITYIGKKQVFNVEKERYSGYLMAMEKNQLEVYAKTHSYFAQDYSFECGYQIAQKLFEQERPTALMVAADILAVGVLQYMYEKGIRIPEDVSVVGHDDTISQYLSPALTSVSLPIEDMAMEAVEMLIGRKNNIYHNARCISISPRIIERNSVKSLHK